MTTTLRFTQCFLPLALVAAACARGASVPAPAAPPAASATPVTSPVTSPVTRPPVPFPTTDSGRALVAPARLPETAADSFLVRFTTSKGEFDVMVRASWAPYGAARVHEAVTAGYYDRARFFRAVRGFVVQFGLAADSARTAEWRTRRMPDDTVRQSNRRGTLSFAAGGPNTRTTQLFFNLRDNARLDALGFSPVGEVVRGIDVMDALHTGYGEAQSEANPAGRGPSQGRISAEGEAYLAREFPLLDQILSARVVQGWPGAR